MRLRSASVEQYFFQAAAVAALARQSVVIDGIMAKFPGQPALPGHKAPFRDDAAAHALPGEHIQHILRGGLLPVVPELGEGAGVRVVDHQEGEVEALGQGRPDRVVLPAGELRDKEQAIPVLVIWAGHGHARRGDLRFRLGQRVFHRPADARQGRLHGFPGRNREFLHVERFPR